MWTSEQRELPAHPDAKYRGKRVELTKEVQGGITLKLELQVDSRDPSMWGLNSVTLWIEPIITETSYKNLGKIAELGCQLKGPLGELIRDAIGQIDHNLVRPY